MNLNNYDAVEPINNKGSWVNPIYKKLYSTEIEYHPYFSFLKRYNIKLNCTDYYIILSDNPIPNIENRGVVKDKNGKIKINLTPIWNDTNLRLITETTTINIIPTEKTDNGIIYYIDV